jgi:chromosome segregation ATPase
MQNFDMILGAVSTSTVLAAIAGLLKSARGRKILFAALDADTGLDKKITDAVQTSVSALQAALDVRGEELARMEKELSTLQQEVANLKAADDYKSTRIAELETEIVALRAENDVLRAELARRRGGRPRKDSSES